MLKNIRPSVIAQPLAEREWQVIAGQWRTTHGGRVIGFIEELGGTYEVEILERPELCQFFGTFKEAIEYFEYIERATDELDDLQVSAAC